LAHAGAAREHWNELNIGPYYLDYQSDEIAARNALDQAEQLRWVLSGLLEAKDLPSLWPIRLIVTKKNAGRGLITRDGQYIAALGPGEKPPLAAIAGVLLDANTPRLPAEAESGLQALLGTIEAHGSKVTWGGPPPNPDLAFARMQLFATKFEYTLSFHIFVAALKSGSSIRVAEQNAFGKNPDVLEKEAADRLAAGQWDAVAVSGRPLDPKRDFGVHDVDAAYVGAYLAAATLDSDPKGAEAAFKQAVEAGGAAMPVGYEGLADLAKRDGRDPLEELEDAMRAGSTSAPVYVAAAKGKPPQEALVLLKKAILYNPKWAEPVYQEAQLQPADTEADRIAKEALLKQALALDPRRTDIWIDLAHLQANDGHAALSQGSWLRAAESASTPAEKKRIEDMAASTEEDRLNAAEAERKREREAAIADDQRAQDAELARIKAAEDKANANLNGSGDDPTPEKVVPWEDTLPKKTVRGQLVKVDCVRGGARLSVRDRTGKTVLLFLQKPADAGLDCAAPPSAPRKVTVAYAVDPDEAAHTAGRVLSMQYQ
jgi:hypothetical protein